MENIMSKTYQIDRLYSNGSSLSDSCVGDYVTEIYKVVTKVDRREINVQHVSADLSQITTTKEKATRMLNSFNKKFPADPPAKIVGYINKMQEIIDECNTIKDLIENL